MREAPAVTSGFMGKILPLLSLLLLAAAPVIAAPFEQTTIAEGFRDPMSITPAPDGDVYLVEREGRLLRIRPSTGGVFEIGNLPVSALHSIEPTSDTAREDALHGIALDPDFAKNHRIFLFYSVPAKVVDRLSRFELREGKLDLASELVLFEVPTQRDDRICHHGGSVQFGPGGLLHISLGDNTNPFASDGMAPIDNRPDRTPWDAERSAGNTNDLRGKILRIRPTETGYDIPPGNLFPKGTPKTRPEIYAMGCRNPFRMSVDPKNGTVYWGEVGPDSAKDSEKGPAGQDEINQAKTAGNFGWPFLVGNNKPYPIVDFTTGKPGRMTDPAAPLNTGIRNTGLTDLPPAQSAFIWYPYADSVEFAIMGKGGRNAMAGPVFYYDPARRYNLLPKEDDHTLITYDWIRGKLWKAKLGAGEKLQKLELLAAGFRHPMDMEMAADGSIWLLDYGSDWYFNKNGKLLHLLSPSNNHSPEIAIAPVAGKDRTFTVKSATDPDGDKLVVTWWLSVGVDEEKLGEGSTAVVPAGRGTEIRAVASDGKSENAVARISLIKEVAAPDLKLTLVEKNPEIAFGKTLTFKVTGTPNPDAAKTTVTARYIPPTGHDAGGPQFSPEMNARVTANQCLACHQVDHPSVGPSYLKVALKYRDRPDALEYLKAKVKAGGGGVWGQVPMPPQIALSEADAEPILQAILDLSQGISQSDGTLAGKIALPAQPPAAGKGGAWEFTAEAPGFTAAKFRMPAK